MEELIPEVGLLLGLNKTPIRYWVHSNVQALTPSNLVPRLSAREWDCGAKACTHFQVITMGMRCNYDKRPPMVNQY